MNYVSPQELRDSGVLLEINRQLLHPLGLAMEVDYPAGDRIRVQDHRDDPEGVYMQIDAEAVARGEQVDDEWDRRQPERVARLGFMVQPREVFPS